MQRKIFYVLVIASFLGIELFGQVKKTEISLTHVSFDISREVIRALSDAFIAEYQAKNPNQLVTVETSHAGSSKQVQAVLNGFQADLVTMNQFLDLQNLYDLSKSKTPLIPASWQKELPNGASPFASTMVFVVRKGNPKKIATWKDLQNPGVKIVAPNFKTTGNGRFSYLTAYAWAKTKAGFTENQVREFVAAIIRNVPVFANGGRDATNLFDQRGQGDVLLTFEAEAYQILAQAPGLYEVITPDFGLLTRVYAVTVEAYAKNRGTTSLAKAYWDFVYSPKGQALVSAHFFRPAIKQAAQDAKSSLPDLDLQEFESIFGDWEKVEKDHFAAGGIYDSIFRLK